MVESSLDYKAINIDDNGPGNSSIGLCQLSYYTARLLGFRKDKNCTGTVNKKCKLYIPEINVMFAGLYLQKQYLRYNKDIGKTLSAYNAGSAIKGNKSYVQKVLKAQRGVK